MIYSKIRKGKQGELPFEDKLQYDGEMQETKINRKKHNNNKKAKVSRMKEMIKIQAEIKTNERSNIKDQ